MQCGEIVRTPKLIHYDKANHVLIMEDVGQLLSLKEWMQPEVDRTMAQTIGQTLGSYLAGIHNITQQDKRLLADFDGNGTARQLSSKLYFGTLVERAARFGHTDSFIGDAAKVGEYEVLYSYDVLTLGDFWTGNILVSGTSQEDIRLFVIDLELSKPGTAEFDIGQMAAEMYCLATFRNHANDQSLAMLEAFLVAYKATRKVTVDAAKVAVRLGSHWLVIMPMAWAAEATPDQIRTATFEGRELARMGWERDTAALRSTVLDPLL